jgi:hypothetical protein
MPEYRTQRQMRAHFTICAKRSAGSDHVARVGGTRKPSVAGHRGSEVRWGWGCGAQLTGRNTRAHFTICAKRPAASDNVERRRGTLKVKSGRPAGPQMKCGWGCGEQLTGRNMRAHFTRCPKRPAASDHVDWKPTGAANAMRLALRYCSRQRSGEGMRGRVARSGDLVDGLARTKRPYR